MWRLIKAENLKLVKNKSFIVGCIACIFIASTIGILSHEYIRYEIIKPEIESQIDNIKEEAIFTGKFMSLVAENPLEPTVREIFHSSFSLGMLEVLIAILIGGVLIKEYTRDTLKNILAYGISRKKLYLAKFISILSGLSNFILILGSTGLIESSIFIGGWGEEFKFTHIFNMLLTVISTIVVASAVIAIIMLCAIIMKNISGVIGGSVMIFIFLPNFISFLYGKYIIFDKIFELTTFYNMSVATSIYAGNIDRGIAIIISLITTSVFLFIGMKIFEKQDIK